MNNYNSLKLNELKKLAKELGIKGYSRDSKKTLIEKIILAVEKTSTNSDTANNTDTTKQEKEIISNSKDNLSDSNSEKSSNDSNFQNLKDSVESRDLKEEEKPSGSVEKEEKSQDFQKQEDQIAGGVLEILSEGYGFLRGSNYLSTENDVYVSPAYIKRFRLKTGDYIEGLTKDPKNGEKFKAILYINSINGQKPDMSLRRNNFDSLTAIYPNQRIILDNNDNDLTARIIELVTPIGKGQRGLIVAPPKAGKTTILKNIANSIVDHNKEIELIILLVDERPEEVTDIKESVHNAEVIYSTFDEMPSHHVKVAEMVLNRAKSLVEYGKDVFVLLDSITRLARAYNLVITPTGRTLSGGLDPGALYGPKKFFGAARNIKEKGSLTILATALIDTGSRMDDMIYEEFKGTGNMELHLDRSISEKRVYPAIDIPKSGTRKDELLLNKYEIRFLDKIKNSSNVINNLEMLEELISLVKSTENNKKMIKEFFTCCCCKEKHSDSKKDDSKKADSKKTEQKKEEES